MKISNCPIILLLLSCTLELSLGSGSLMSLSLSAHYMKHDKAHVILIMKGEVQDVINSINSRSFKDANDKTLALRRQLDEFTQERQQNVLSFLKRRASSSSDSKSEMVVKPFYITNRISIRNAPKSVILDLMRDHGNDIEEIRHAVVIQPYEPIIHDDDGAVNLIGRDANVKPWSLDNIGVPKVKYTGKGVVVGIVDSGVRGGHEALFHNMRETYNWFDAQNHTSKPFDIMGHGTHCTGTILGGNNIGVSPDSEWMACRIFDKKGAEEDVILACGQFIFCPTLPDGTKEDCTKRPNVCSNSWGGGQDSHFFNDVILAWRAAGIIPVFAIGNSGPSCGSANSPGDQDNLISVGASTAKNGIAVFSSRGPSASTFLPRLKPDISAPGFRIISSYTGHDGKYASLSGTSMATPAITGCVAVLLSKKPTATFTEIYDALRLTAYQPYLTANMNHQCYYEGVANSTTAWPNNIFGYGIVRLDAALDYLKLTH